MGNRYAAAVDSTSRDKPPRAPRLRPLCAPRRAVLSAGSSQSWCLRLCRRHHRPGQQLFGRRRSAHPGWCRSPSSSASSASPCQHRHAVGQSALGLPGGREHAHAGLVEQTIFAPGEHRIPLDLDRERLSASSTALTKATSSSSTDDSHGLSAERKKKIMRRNFIAYLLLDVAVSLHLAKERPVRWHATNESAGR